MTVSEMDTYVSQLLNDTSSYTWTQIVHRLPALNTSQEELVNSLLAFGTQSDNVYELLSEITESEAVTLDNAGLDMSTLTGNPIRNGYVASKIIINQLEKWVVRKPLKRIAQYNNPYKKGTDKSPKCYILDNKYFLEINNGSYPVTGTIYFIRKPYTLATTAGTEIVSTCELNIMFHRIICKMAAKECYRIKGDQASLTKYENLRREIDEQIKSFALGSASENKSAGTE
jgi:hypothetical protein